MDKRFKDSVAKWDPKLHVYIPYEVHKEATTYEEDMNKQIRCAACIKKIEYGKCYTSMQIHTRFGIAYMVCPECYDKEIEDERSKFSR